MNELGVNSRNWPCFKFAWSWSYSTFNYRGSTVTNTLIQMSEIYLFSTLQFPLAYQVKMPWMVSQQVHYYDTMQCRGQTKRPTEAGGSCQGRSGACPPPRNFELQSLGNAICSVFCVFSINTAKILVIYIYFLTVIFWPRNLF